MFGMIVQPTSIVLSETPWQVYPCRQTTLVEGRGVSRSEDYSGGKSGDGGGDGTAHSARRVINPYPHRQTGWPLKRATENGV